METQHDLGDQLSDRRQESRVAYQMVGHQGRESMQGQEHFNPLPRVGAFTILHTKWEAPIRNPGESIQKEESPLSLQLGEYHK